MALEAGSRLGAYEILSLIGSGGMGEVYRARDTRLHRTVAIKILSREKTADPERRRRFIQEARAASALNHTNIVTVHDIASESGVDYLVMEYVAGRSLDKLITPKGMSLVEAPAYAAQIASALAVAHAAGIVHRDIKPANVIVTPESQVKILDFGVAKLMERAQSGDAETVMQETTLTEAGRVIGTVEYMSPEQARAQPLDHRTDIFSLGVMLYEMLVGRRPFRGTSPIEIMHAIIHDPVAPPGSQPAPLRDILDKALAKDPKERYQHAGDFALDLRRLQRKPPEAEPQMGASRARLLPWAAAILLALAIPLAWWFGKGARAETLRAAASLINLAGYTGTERSGAISPDGKFFVFVSDRGGEPDIWVRQISGGDPVQVTRDPAAKLDLIYAPDGESIYYTTAAIPRTIWRIGVLGGTPRKIVNDARYPAPSPDGKRLAYVRHNEILEIAGTDGTGARQVATIRGIQYPQWSPDGRWLAYTAGTLFDTYQVNLIDANGKNQRQLTSFLAGTIFCITWLPGGHDIVFSRSPVFAPDSSDLFSVSVDTGVIRRRSLNPKGSFSSCSVTADGKRLLGTMDDTDFELWKAPLDGDAVSNGKAAVRILDRTWEPLWAQLPQAGRLPFSSPATGVRNLWIMPLGPNATPRQVTFVPSATITHSALSPDGSQVAYVSTESGSGQIWVANSDGSAARQLTNNAATNFWPFWSFDGQWVAFTSTRPGPPDIWKISAQGGTPVQVTHSNGFRGDWSPDGRRIVYDTQVFQGGPRERENQVAAVEIAEASSGKVLTQVRAPNLTSPVWSPDGRHISATAANSVWVIDPETGEQRRAVQFPQGFFALFRAVWTPDGKAVIVNRQERTFRVVLIDNF